ncbi:MULTISPECIES: sigma-70 family RNA polymerase sigma factor [Tsukamurella]|uniref:Sigma-70 family RNA polymerase sigma factor n=2 Tax=Tsukamurella TaxID=2060 RepID=A0A5C5S5K3_9ACTN|nr:MULTISPECIES: sigma-70 family RNA polymerase sigma factor [Tsukamurella]NMD55275.1 sigma-70 family RNA polymerase sigma factor [Tsukamurella columbiensis]TWS30756.1 sigma-70 family RNA polymerase sigma factor [Tsukamurella conjunctivitidis]
MDRTTRTEQFEQHRSRLIAVATRALGSRADAEDAVQEAWLRLDRYDGAPIENLGGWLTRVVGRICIDVLRSRAVHPVVDIDDADPVVTDDDGPEDIAIAADAVGLALMMVLESLGPEERLAFVLHDLFAVPFAEVGAIVGRSSDAAKMAASRARRRVQAGGGPVAERREQRAVVDAFLAAAREGDFEALLAVLDPDLTWTRRTSRGETVTIGADAVLDAVRRGDPSRIEARRVSVNGAAGILVWGPTGRPVALMACTVVGARIVDVVSILDAARLGRMDLPAR